MGKVKTAVAVIAIVLLSWGPLSQAKEIKEFKVSDGSAAYYFTLSQTGRKLFFFSYQRPGWGDMRNTFFAYEAVGPAPLDNPVMRAEIAQAVKRLTVSVYAHIDTTNPVELPLGITCYPVIVNSDNTETGGLAIRFKSDKGNIKGIEVADSDKCQGMKGYVIEYEAMRGKRKAGKQ